MILCKCGCDQEVSKEGTIKKDMCGKNIWNTN